MAAAGQGRRGDRRRGQRAGAVASSGTTALTVSAGSSGRRSSGRARAGVRRGGDVSGMQRARLLGAAVAVIDGEGLERASVERIVSRARVSRRTFYNLFEDREGCLLAIFDGVVRAVETELAGVWGAQASVAGESWAGRVRRGLVAVLAFLDREPAAARVCLLCVPYGGSRARERYRVAQARLAGEIDRGRVGSRGDGVGELTAEGLVGACAGMVANRLSGSREGATAGRENTVSALARGRASGAGASLLALTNELMSLIVLPYLGPAAAKRELHREVEPPAISGECEGGVSAFALAGDDPLQGLDMRLTYRTARVLAAIAELSVDGACPSNREVGDRAGVRDQGQISKLLARLERLGLVVDASEHAHRFTGEANAWCLTERGVRVQRGMRVEPSGDER